MKKWDHSDGIIILPECNVVNAQFSQEMTECFVQSDNMTQKAPPHPAGQGGEEKKMLLINDAGGEDVSFRSFKQRQTILRFLR